MVSRAVLGSFLALCLAACATGPQRPEAPTDAAPTEGPQTQTPARLPPQDAAPGLRTASAGLLGEAREARRRGDLRRAEAVLQRAQRLDPANALVYLELAQLYLQRGQPESARAAAERGLLYCDAGSCDELREIARP